MIAPYEGQGRTEKNASRDDFLKKHEKALLRRSRLVTDVITVDFMYKEIFEPF